MSSPALPSLIQPDELEPLLGRDDLLVIDLCKPETYRQAHIPGAVHLDYSQIVAVRKPMGGLLPDDAQLSTILSGIGLRPEKHVVAYDDEGGGRACRMLWTLAAIGHSRYSLLDGGLIAWANEAHRLSQEPVTPVANEYRVSTHNNAVVADKDYIIANLDNADVALLDARSEAEYTGAKALANRAGHIPGAANLDWMLTIDRNRNARLLTEPDLRHLLESRGLTPDKEIVVYCQTHHRSAHSFFMLSYLGYPRVRGYPGSWSEWGNLDDTPVER